MRKHEIATLAFKILALYCFLEFVKSLGALLANWSGRFSATFPFLTTTAITLAVAILIWKNAGPLARNVFPDPSDDPQGQSSPLNCDGALEIAFPIIGLCIIVTMVPALFYWVSLYFFGLHGGYQSVMGGRASLTPEQWSALFDVKAKAAIISEILELIIGIIFIFAPDRCLLFIKKLTKYFSGESSIKTTKTE